MKGNESPRNVTAKDESGGCHEKVNIPKTRGSQLVTDSIQSLYVVCGSRKTLCKPRQLHNFSSLRLFFVFLGFALIPGRM